MKALIVYDSRSGHTEALARAIAADLDAMDATVCRVGDRGAGSLAGVDLLVVGCPTEGHGATPAMRAWLNDLGIADLDGLPVAVFDTRLGWPRLLSGSAADEIAAYVSRNGALLLRRPESFIVHGRDNPPPTAAELEHAKGWANLVFDALPVPA